MGSHVPAVFLPAVIVLVLAFVALVFLAVGFWVALVEGFVAGIVGSAREGEMLASLVGSQALRVGMVKEAMGR